ncbi:MAG: hypothetical protein Kow00104_02590 [Rhodothalassiaceae bacterium]
MCASAPPRRPPVASRFPPHPGAIDFEVGYRLRALGGIVGWSLEANALRHNNAYCSDPKETALAVKSRPAL